MTLIKAWKVSATTSVLRFGLPDTRKPLNLSTCAHVLAKADIRNSEGQIETVTRPYTPISTNKQIGSFDLLIKDYGDNGTMSRHLCQLEPGEAIDFKHIRFNVKMQAPFPYKKVAMMVGGTGIAPMVQALHAILGDSKSTTTVDMLYGSRVSTDILGKEMLDAWANIDRLKVTHVLSHEPDKSSWTGERGFITKEMIAKHFPSPEDEDFIIFICGPPIMYDIFCGPRGQKEVTGLLKEMGYSDSQVYKF